MVGSHSCCWTPCQPAACPCMHTCCPAVPWFCQHRRHRTFVMPPEQLLWQLVKPLSSMMLSISACTHKIHTHHVLLAS